MIHFHTHIFNAPDPEVEADFFTFLFNVYFPLVFQIPEVKLIKGHEEFSHTGEEIERPVYGYFILLDDQTTPFDVFLRRHAEKDPRLAEAMEVFDEWFNRPELAESSVADDYTLEYTFANAASYCSYGEKPLILFLSEIHPEKADQFEDWYRGHYIPNLLPNVPHIETCHRYRAWNAESPRYLTIYNLKDENGVRHAMDLMTRPHCQEHVEQWRNMAEECVKWKVNVKLRGIHLRVRDKRPCSCGRVDL